MRQLEDGRWQSRGEAFEVLMARMRSMGPKGFRAVLWHQGESDANQKDPKYFQEISMPSISSE